MPDKATTWGVGDYPAMARRLVPAALAAVSAAKIQTGDRVLNVAAAGFAREHGVPVRTVYRHQSRIRAEGQWQARSRRPKRNPSCMLNN